MCKGSIAAKWSERWIFPHINRYDERRRVAAIVDLHDPIEPPDMEKATRSASAVRRDRYPE
jgi:hypothetical protein